MTSRIRNPVLGCLASVFGLFAVTLLAFKVGAGEHADARLLASLTAEPGTTAHKLATLFAHLADPVPTVLMLAGLCALALHWGRRREAIAAVVVVAGASLTTEVLKALFSHERFWTFLGEGQPWTNSFPSGHTTAAASIAVAALLVAPARLRGPALALGAGLTAAVGLSVVVLEWHYPSDVLGGLVIAVGWGFATLAGLRLAEPVRREPDSQASSRFAISVK